MLLRGRADVERWHVNDLVAHTDVALADEHTRMVDALGKRLLVDLRLQASLEEFLGRKLQHFIEFELVVGEQTISVHASQKGSSLEDALRVIRLEGQQGSGRLTELGKSILNAPDLALAPEAVFAH